MSDTIGDGSYEDYLAHYGVKGMRWGKRGAGGSSSGTASAAPASKSQQIKAARKKIRDTANKHSRGEYDAQMGTTAKARQKGRENAAKALKELEKMQTDGTGKLAGKYTRGEKITVGLLYGVTGAIVVASSR